ncbi:ankyrin repeat domain-containing protein [Candidatus Rariloculus sp.]|uniref:ankyrin repeat domain-containing protein n=1 Tax=Candidatus Rariloculus sp. TaxID=3101265 RepID=UPI003D0BE322
MTSRGGASRRLRFLAALLSIGAAGAPLKAAELVDAAERDDLAAALAALEAGADVNTRLVDGTTAVHWAVYRDNVELVDELIEAGADVNAANDFGSTPLGEAAVTGNLAVVERLLAAGADVGAPGPDGQTPLMVVARGNNVAAARALLERGADVNARETWRNQTALIWAAAQEQPEMVKLLLEYGADPNARSDPNDWQRQVSAERRRLYRPFGGLTALMYAARQGCVECVRALVEGGADPDLSGPRNETPLIVAINNFHFDVAAYLVDAGAMLDIWDWWGRTPLYTAVDMDTIPRGGRPDRRSTDETTSLELIEQILAAGANPNVQLKLVPPYRARGPDRGCDSMLTVGATPLLRAAKTFDTPAMRLLIEHGAMLELPNESGITPLMAAAGYGSLECDIRGYGPGIPHYLTEDVQEKSIEALAVLLEAGADLEARSTGGRGGRGGRGPGQTALFGAAFWGWNDAVEFLVDRGAKIDARDAEGRTAVDAALGRAGGHERGSSIVVFEDTAKLLVALCSAQPDCELPES